MTGAPAPPLPAHAPFRNPAMRPRPAADLAPRRRAAALARRRGFTLVEIIVVIVIIGVLAGLIAPRILNRVGQSKRAVAEANAASVASAVTNFMLDCGPIPAGATLEGILMQAPADVADGKWQGPYLNNKESLLDPWDQPFILKVPGEKNADFDIVSYGADKQPGGDGEAKDVVKP